MGAGGAKRPREFNRASNRGSAPRVGRATGTTILEGVIDGIVGGMMGDLVMTLTDVETFKKSLWEVVCTAGQAVIRGGALGGATSALR